MEHRDFHRTRLQNFCAERCHLQHFLERDLFQTARFWNDARVGGVNAIDVSVDVATIRFQRGGDGNGAGIRTTPP
jgi:hypothetical protein